MSKTVFDIYPSVPKPEWLRKGVRVHCLGEAQDVFTVEDVNRQTCSSMLSKPDGSAHGRESWSNLSQANASNSSAILDKKNDLAMPDGLTTRGKLAYQLIMGRLTQFKNKSTGGCRAFYSPVEWAERGEEHGKNAVLIVVYDGSDVKYHFNMDRSSEMKKPYQTTEMMQELLRANGFHYEEATHWYACIYDDKYHPVKKSAVKKSAVKKSAVKKSDVKKSDGKKSQETRQAKAIVRGDSGHSPYLVGVSWKKLLTGLVGKWVKITIEEILEPGSPEPGSTEE